MSQPFATSLASNQYGSGALSGAGNARSGNSAQDGLFSTLVSLVNGTTSAPKPSDIIQIGSPDFTGEAWVNLQMGDVSLSLSSQAMTTAMTPQTMLTMIPGVLDDLNLDQAVLNGMTKLGETAQTKPDAQSTINQAILANSGSSANDEALLSIIAQNNSAAGKTAGSVLPVVAISLSEQLSSALTQKDATQQQLVQIGMEQAAARTNDNLAAQLQRQLAVEGDVKQNANTQTQAQAMNMGQNASNAAAALSQLPVVQTREILTSTDPLLVAQNLGLSNNQAAQTALFKPVQAAYQGPQVNVPNVAMEITRHVNAGNNQFQIRLDPAELGRINVRLHMDDGGNVNARLVVERPETLAMLQRDAHSLERALAQAGLDSSKTNLEFSLKQNPFAGDQFASNDDNNASDQNNSETEQNQNHSPPDLAVAAYQGTVSPSGISLWV